MVVVVICLRILPQVPQPLNNAQPFTLLLCELLEALQPDFSVDIGGGVLVPVTSGAMQTIYVEAIVDACLRARTIWTALRLPGFDSGRTNIAPLIVLAFKVSDDTEYNFAFARSLLHSCAQAMDICMRTSPSVLTTLPDMRIPAEWKVIIGTTIRRTDDKAFLKHNKSLGLDRGIGRLQDIQVCSLYKAERQYKECMVNSLVAAHFLLSREHNLRSIQSCGPSIQADFLGSDASRVCCVEMLAVTLFTHGRFEVPPHQVLPDNHQVLSISDATDKLRTSALLRGKGPQAHRPPPYM